MNEFVEKNHESAGNGTKTGGVLNFDSSVIKDDDLSDLLDNEIVKPMNRLEENNKCDSQMD